MLKKLSLPLSAFSFRLSTFSFWFVVCSLLVFFANSTAANPVSISALMSSPVYRDFPINKDGEPQMVPPAGETPYTRRPRNIVTTYLIYGNIPNYQACGEDNYTSSTSSAKSYRPLFWRERYVYAKEPGPERVKLGGGWIKVQRGHWARLGYYVAYYKGKVAKVEYKVIRDPKSRRLTKEWYFVK